MKKNIDIIVRVIDNFGDIGFAGELLISANRHMPEYAYRIWTDSVEKVTDFFAYNKHLLPDYSVYPLDELHQMRGVEVMLLLFQAMLPPDEIYADRTIVLRIDYLSLDPIWTAYHGASHPLSHAHRQIYQIIPSIGEDAGGLLAPLEYDASYDRAKIAQMFGLRMESRWIGVFVYPDTFSRLDISELGEDKDILVFGMPESQLELPYVCMPFLPIDVFHACIDQCEWVIIRGEVSFVSTILSGKKFYWDMYHTLGGRNHEQSAQFSDLIENPGYRDLHRRLNDPTTGNISLSELDQFSQENSSFFPDRVFRTKNLIIEIKKYIDSHQFSI